MKRFKWAVLIVFILPFFLAAWISGKPARQIITLQLTQYEEQMKMLQSLEIDVAGVNFPEKRVDVIVTSKQKDFLLVKLEGVRVTSEKLLRSTGVDTSYKTPEKIEALLKDFAQKYPELTELVDAGKSLEGRSIWALKITDKTAPAGTKPAILFNGMHHAREVMTPEIPLDIADYLLSHYKDDARVKHWVDANEIWVLPMLNVDGNNIVWNTDNYWRKNAREGYGVDINRNYPYAWSKCNGSSGQKWSETYRGSKAASEPETQTLMNLVAKIRPVIDISLHSYSELVLYPYGCKGQRALTKKVVEGLGKQLADLLPSDEREGQNYTAGTPWETLYSVDGGDIDWMYNQFGVLAYTIEINGESQGFQPSYDTWRDVTVNKLRKGWMMLLDKLDGSAVRGQITDEAGKALSDATVTLSGTDGVKQVQAVNANGYFHVVLEPGAYSVQFDAKGYKTTTQEVKVEAARVDTNVKLVPVAMLPS